MGAEELVGWMGGGGVGYYDVCVGSVGGRAASRRKSGGCDSLAGCRIRGRDETLRHMDVIRIAGRWGPSSFFSLERFPIRYEGAGARRPALRLLTLFPTLRTGRGMSGPHVSRPSRSAVVFRRSLPGFGVSTPVHMSARPASRRRTMPTPDDNATPLLISTTEVSCRSGHPPLCAASFPVLSLTSASDPPLFSALPIVRL